jgi:UPF0755 protein
MNRLLKISIVLGTPLLCGALVYGAVRYFFEEPVNRSDTAEKLVEIAPDKNFGEICDVLMSKGLLKSCLAFKVLARLQGLDTAIKAGEYMMSPAMRPIELLKKLEKGEVLQRRVTLKEGESIWTLGKSVEEAGLVSREEFDMVLVDRTWLTKFGVLGDSFEGYLFPETYMFSRPIKPEQIVFRMLEMAEGKWKPEYTERAEELGLSRHEILTLASIVQKESGGEEDQPLIASVFFNRMQQGMKLQSDPTVIYGIPNFNGNLTKIDLETVTPYNTYTNNGLPPGPICNPGESALKAVLYAPTTNYLFFVGNGKGQHVFSTTLAEHNEAVRKYQIEPFRKARAEAAAQAGQPEGATP